MYFSSCVYGSKLTFQKNQKKKKTQPLTEKNEKKKRKERREKKKNTIDQPLEPRLFVLFLPYILNSPLSGSRGWLVLH